MVLPPALAGLVAQTSLDPLQVVTIMVGLAVALAVGRAKQKDSTIADLKNAIETEERLHGQTRRELDGAAARAESERSRRHQERDRRHECENEIGRMRGQLETLERYAAPEAFKEIATALGEIRGTFGGALSAQGELLLKANELGAGAMETLRGMAEDQKATAEALATIAKDLERVAADRPPA